MTKWIWPKIGEYFGNITLSETNIITVALDRNTTEKYNNIF